MAEAMWNAMAAHREAILAAAEDRHEKAGRTMRTLADLSSELRGGYLPLTGKKRAAATPPHPMEEAFRAEAAARLQAEGNAATLRLLWEMSIWEP